MADTGIQIKTNIRGRCPVSRGTSFAITAKPGVEYILLGFECNQSRGLVEVHIKFS